MQELAAKKAKGKHAEDIGSAEPLTEPRFSLGKSGRLEITAQSQTNKRVYLFGRFGLSKEGAAEITAAVVAAFEAGSPTKAEVKTLVAKLPSQP